MDITMPEMDGITALKAIREKDPNAVVVMCTAMGQKKHGLWKLFNLVQRTLLLSLFNLKGLFNHFKSYLEKKN
jgi:CheY-like chemotaxis protein